MNGFVNAHFTLNLGSTHFRWASQALRKSRFRKSSDAGATTRSIFATALAKNQTYQINGPQRKTRTFQPGEDKHELPVQVLGSSSNVLVLTDAAQTSKQRKIKEAREKAVTNPASQDGPSPTDLLRSTKEGDVKADSGEVNRHLEEIRTALSSKKSSDGLLTPEQYEETQTALRASFSPEQLKEYYSSIRSGAEPSRPNELPSQSSHLYESHAWTQGTSPFPETALARMKSAGNPQQLPHLWARGKVVDQILHHCWGFRSEGELTSEGELDLRISAGIRELFFNLHGTGDSSLFARIASEYGARIDASRSSGLLRITANYKSCHATLRLINFALENIRSDTIDISLDDAREGISMPIVPATQLEAIWAKVAKLTNTTISAVRSKERASLIKLTVRSMGPSDADFIMAQRLVVRAVDALRERTIPLFHEPFDTKALRCAEIANAKSPPWASCGPLLRGTLPKPFEKEKTGEKDQPSGRSSNFGVPEEAMKALRSQVELIATELIPTSERREPHWHGVFGEGNGIEQQHKINASLGLLAFSPIVPQRLSQAVFDFAESKSYTRTLTSGTANMSGLAVQFADLQSNFVDQFKIRLVPLINDDVLLHERPPIIETGVRFDRTVATSTLNRIKLIYGTKTADLMMPSFHTDARIESRQVMHHSEDAEFSWRPIIQQFITANRLDVWGSNLTSVPLEIVLPLPLAPSGDTPSDTVAHIAQVRYRIVDMDYRSQLRLRSAGIKMVYSRILPTDLDGPRDELTFQVSQPISTSVEARRKTFEQFYNTIITLAYNVRSGDYLQLSAAERQETSKERTEAERVLSDVMRSAADTTGTGSGIGARQKPSRAPIDEEIDLLLESIGTKTQSSRSS